jgi:hypothetical protein
VTKPTLGDFIENPFKAMRNGYYPDFMSCLSLKASSFGIKQLNDIKGEFFWILNQEAILFPTHLLSLAIYTFLILTTPILFPGWALIFWFNVRQQYKRYHEKMKSKSTLIVEYLE